MPSSLPRSPKDHQPHTLVIHHGEQTFSLPLLTHDPTKWIPFLFYLLKNPAIILTPIEITANLLAQLAATTTQAPSEPTTPSIPPE